MTTSMMAQTRPQSWDGLVWQIRKAWRRVTHLETAQKSVVNHIVVDLLTRILGAGPTPHVFAVTRGFRVLVDGCTNDPHNEAEEEEAD